MKNGSNTEFPRGGSSLKGFGSSNQTAMNAEILSKATSTATVAARSILMSGGTEEVALKTAKAAAESVLNPTASDTDTISGRSTTFLRRRKARRQAEVVASMALATAASNLQPGASIDWSEAHSNPYGRHITTRSMNTQDEPSVLSNSTRPPRALMSGSMDAHRSLHSKSNMDASINTPTGHRTLAHNTPGYPQDRRAGSPSPFTNLPMAGQRQSASHPNSPHGTPPLHSGSAHSRITGGVVHPGMNPVLTQGGAVATSSTPVVDCISTGASATDKDEFDDETTLECETTNGHGQQRRRGWADPIFESIAGALCLMPCGPVGVSSGQSEIDGMSTVNGSGSRIGGDDTVFSGETDARDDTGTDVRSLDTTSFERFDGREGIQSKSSGESSVDSADLARELQATSSAEEGEIQVRSSIRQTMEKIVSNARKSGRGDAEAADRTWLSYELRQDDMSSHMNSNSVLPSPGPQSVSSKTSRKSFFRRKKQMRNQSGMTATGQQFW